MNESKKLTSTNPIIQKCLDILYSGKAIVDRTEILGVCYMFFVYVDGKRYFTVTDSWVAVGEEKFRIDKYSGGLDFSDISLLYAKCLETVPSDEKKLESALNSLDKAHKIVSAPAPVSFRERVRAFFARGRAR